MSSREQYNKSLAKVQWRDALACIDEKHFWPPMNADERR
jgi:hypothetical protein